MLPGRTRLTCIVCSSSTCFLGWVRATHTLNNLLQRQVGEEIRQYYGGS